MGSEYLSEIIVTPLKRIPVVGGDVLHAMKNSDIGFLSFGEAYFSWLQVDAIKAWKKHASMTLNLIVPVGFVRFVFLSPRSKQNFRVENIGESRYVRLTVPPGIWFGFKNLSQSPSLVLNIADIQHEPSEVERLELEEINYGW